MKDELKDEGKRQKDELKDEGKRQKDEKGAGIQDSGGERKKEEGRRRKEEGRKEGGKGRTWQKTKPRISAFILLISAF